VERDDGRARVRFAGPVQVDDLARLIAGDTITQLVLEPPPLSEVFTKAVEQ
jgi:hypothetical protein